ncbi:head GIN domain-containing protein [Pontibacter sp. G13]|uniref:head GIN domain-containing protein n=1 Tax=Pontibacter sp. G13 TaxID=3074898 RepID=UPI0028895B43|nr:head GIN domain-containing protein [Pontibacter sp. G13]WNJ18544.1 head GIN domain-containing protein [Pontibacter sp. G13]
MSRFLKILFYGAVTLGLMAFFYGDKFFGAFNDGCHRHESHKSHGCHSTERHGHHSYDAHDLAGFDRVKVGGNYEVILVQDDEFKVSIDSDSPESIDAYVSASQLVIMPSKKWGRDQDQSARITIALPVLRKLQVEGSADVETRGTLQTDRLCIKFSGASEADLDIEADNLEVHMSGASDMNLSGSADQMEIKASGAGEIQAKDLQAEHVQVSVSGAGSVSVYASESLQASASGAGNVTFRGNPSQISQHVSGAGSIRSK